MPRQGLRNGATTLVSLAAFCRQRPALRQIAVPRNAGARFDETDMSLLQHRWLSIACCPVKRDK